MSRLVGYAYEAPEGAAHINETPVEHVLSKARRAGTVTQFDTGRGLCVWFNGRPGRALRAVRDEVLSLLPKTWRAAR